jgi:hypothetical protein
VTIVLRESTFDVEDRTKRTNYPDPPPSESEASRLHISVIVFSIPASAGAELNVIGKIESEDPYVNASAS